MSDVVVAQHRLVFVRMEGVRRGRRPPSTAARARFAAAVLAHWRAENEILYELESDVALRARDDEEHDMVGYALSRILDPAMSAAGAAHQFDARMHTLRSLLVHHCEREERARLPALEARAGRAASRRMGRRLEARFTELEALDVDSLFASVASGAPAGRLSARGEQRARR